MVRVVKNLIGMVLFSIIISGCTQEPSLQRYYVDHQEQPNFLTVDVPVSVLNLNQAELTPDQNDAYKSIKKLNMLAYKKGADNHTAYESELEKVKTILDQPKYEELMRVGNSVDGQFVIKILGLEDDINELIVFGSTNDHGFAIVRVLGNDMNPNKIMSLASALDKANIDNSQISQFTEFFK